MHDDGGDLTEAGVGLAGASGDSPFGDVDNDRDPDLDVMLSGDAGPGTPTSVL